MAGVSILNQSELDEYIQANLGEQFLPLIYSIPITLIYLVILLFGLIGNGFILLVITCNRKMWTSPNCYIFNLAISCGIIVVIGRIFFLNDESKICESNVSKLM